MLLVVFVRLCVHWRSCVSKLGLLKRSTEQAIWFLWFYNLQYTRWLFSGDLCSVGILNLQFLELRTGTYVSKICSNTEQLLAAKSAIQEFLNLQ